MVLLTAMEYHRNESHTAEDFEPVPPKVIQIGTAEDKDEVSEMAEIKHTALDSLYWLKVVGEF